MKNIIEEINHLMIDKGVNRTFLADGIGMTRQNLFSILDGSKKKNDIQAGTLEKMARVLGVPIVYFFDKDVWPTAEYLTGSAHVAWKKEQRDDPGQIIPSVSGDELQVLLQEKLEILKERNRVQDEVIRMVQQKVLAKQEQK